MRRFGVALIAAPGVDVVFELSYDSTTGWQPGRVLRSFDADFPDTRFGAAMHFRAGEAWFGAPGTTAGEGRAYVMSRGSAGEWTGASKLIAADLAPRDEFGATLAVRDDVAAVGIARDDFGLASVAIFERRGGVWSQTGKVFGEPAATFASITSGQVDCEEEEAGAFGCTDVDLLSFLSVAGIVVPVLRTEQY